MRHVNTRQAIWSSSLSGSKRCKSKEKEMSTVELKLLIVLAYQQFETALSHQGKGKHGQVCAVLLVGQLPQAIVVSTF